MPLADINGTKLYYEKHGSGTPIIFIHPPLLTSENFRYQQMQLSDQFTVITFDIRGHGRSPSSKLPLTYTLIAEDIRQLMDHLKIEKAFLAGYSTGGSIALEAMMAYSDRFIGGILISAMSEASDFVLRNRIRIAAALSQWMPSFRLLRLGITWGNADSKLTFRNLLRDAARGDIHNIQQFYEHSLNYNCTDRLSLIDVPMLLLYGEKDWGFKTYHKKLRQGLRQFQSVVIDEEKHQLPTKAANKINEVISKWIGNMINDVNFSNMHIDRDTAHNKDVNIIHDAALEDEDRPVT